MKATDIIQRDHNILRKALASLDRALLMQTPHCAIVAKNVANYLDIGLREYLNSEERWLSRHVVSALENVDETNLWRSLRGGT
jgi:hypothetical protein